MSETGLAPTLAVAALLVVAGCAGGPLGETATTASSTDTSSQATMTADRSTDTGGPTTYTESNGTDEVPSVPVRDEVTVENGSLPVNATLTYARVQALTDTDADPWPVRVGNLSDLQAEGQRVGSVPLNRALGFENASTDWSEPTGVTRVTGVVFIHPGNHAPAKTERVLAHEYVHAIQYETRMLPWLTGIPQSVPSTDLVRARQSLTEGGAVFVADAYAERYLDVRSNSAYARDRYRNGSATARSALAPYVFGSRYVESRIDDPANLSTVYESYPRTTEQVIHNVSRAEEPPANLSVRATGSERWERGRTDTLGEMTTRAALDTELNRERAAAAAAGWGNDRLVAYRHATDDSRDGWVWVMRWDDANETDELRAALSTFADAREGNSTAAFRVEIVDETTVALVFGDPGFVEGAEVTGTDGTVTISVTASRD